MNEFAGEERQPERVAQYRIETRIHEGEHTTVYRAFDETLERSVALKVLSDGGTAPKLIQEARAVSRLQHPHIAGVYQAASDPENDLHFIAFEWVEGETLRARLHRGALGLDDFYRHGAAIAEAVAHAHEHDLIHGDLKADNVVLAQGTDVKLLDFGLSAPDEDLGGDELWGTPAYMAPELFQGAPRTESSDLFALGVLLYELLTGQLPFGGADGDEHGVFERQQKGEVPDVRNTVPELPAPVATALTSLLSFDSARRGPTAAELARFLRLRQSGAKRPVRSIMLWGGLILVAVAFVFRQDVFEALYGKIELAETESVPWVRVSAFVDPASEQGTASSRFGADLVNLFLHGRDPGSALLRVAAADTNAGAEADADFVSTHELTGYWSQQGSQWQASWLGNSAGSKASVVLEAAGAVPLAQRAAESLASTYRNDLSTTLCDSEPALQSFIEGVRLLESGDLAEARKLFAAAQQQAGYFPEAEAWDVMTQILEGDAARAIARLKSLREIDSDPARVLVEALATPVEDRMARWRESHRAAKLLNLLLSWHDPAAPDDYLRSSLEDLGAHGMAELAYMQAWLALEQEDFGEAANALVHYRAFGGDSWHEIVLKRWILVGQGNEAAANDELADWLLDRFERSPGSYLRVPYQLQRGKLDRAVQMALRDADPSAAARRAVARTLSLGGRWDEALEAARAIRDPFDPSAAARMVAAIEVLRGAPEAAAATLREARGSDGGRPDTGFLLDFVETDPFVAAVHGGGSSRFERWRNRFEVLARSRTLRASGRALEAMRLLENVSWVGPDLEVLDWPELGFLAWLERVRCHVDLDQRAEAEAAFREFRRWWPQDRAPLSRVSVLAKLVQESLQEGQ